MSRSVRWAAILGLSLFAMIPLGFSLFPAWQHYGTVTHWPHVSGTVAARTIEDRPSVGYRRSSVMSHSIRDAYLIQRDGEERVCYWNDWVATGIESWTDARVAARNQYWPIGVAVTLYADHDSDRCEPERGWERTGLVIAMVMGLFGLTFLAGAIWIFVTRPKIKGL